MTLDASGDVNEIAHAIADRVDSALASAGAE
jgi:hypothetical protein